MFVVHRVELADKCCGKSLEVVLVEKCCVAGESARVSECRTAHKGIGNAVEDINNKLNSLVNYVVVGEVT